MLILAFIINAIFHWFELVSTDLTQITALLLNGLMLLNIFINQNKLQRTLNGVMERFNVVTKSEREKFLKSSFNMTIVLESVLMFIMWLMMGSSSLIYVALGISLVKLFLAERALNRNIRLHNPQ